MVFTLDDFHFSTPPQEHLYILNFHTGSESWWREHGFNCTVTYNITVMPDGGTQSEVLLVEGCLLDYQYVEVIHAGIQCLFCVSLGVILEDLDLRLAFDQSELESIDLHEPELSLNLSLDLTLDYSHNIEI